MDAKTAAAKIEAGLHTLSDKELIEIYLSLRGNDQYSVQFNKLNSHASSKLEAFAANRKAGMSFEEALDFQRFVSVFGREKGKYTPAGQKAQEALFASIAQIELTPVQKQALDEHGFMYDKTVGSAFDRKSVSEVMRVLESVAAEQGASRPAVTARANGGAAAKSKPAGDNQSQALAIEENKEQLLPSEQVEKSNAQVNRNFTILDGFYGNVNPLDDNDNDFEETRKYLNSLEVVDEEGNIKDVRQEIIDLAKLKTEADLHTADHNEITPQQYKSVLKDNVEQTVYSMMMTDGLVANGTQPQSQVQIRKQIDEAFNGGKKQISSKTASGVLGVKSQEMHSFADRLEAKFKGLPFVKKFKQKLKKVDENLTRKLGKPYVKARTYADMLAKSGAGYDIAMGFVAGFGGPVGLAAYGAYTFYRRSLPLYKAYKEEVKANPEKKGFINYMKQHKKDTVIASLYTASALLSFGTAGALAAANVAQAAGAAQTISSLDQATRYFSHAKAGLAASTVAVRGFADIYEARKNNGNVKSAVKRTLASVALFGVGYGLREYLAADHQNGGKTGLAEPHPSAGNDPVSQIVDENHNGIPDHIERPVENSSSQGNGIHAPWQDNATGQQIAAENAPAPVAENTLAADANAAEYTVGAREQSVYERNLVYVKDSDIMVSNVNDGLVALPKGMTPEMAVNLARVEQLYYGNDTTLKILMDCDEIKGVHFTEEMKLAHLNKVAAMFTDKCSEPYGVGFPRDPDYGYVDPNIRVDLVNTGDCDDETKLRYVRGSNTQPSKPITPVRPVDPVTPVEPVTPVQTEPEPLPPLGTPVKPDLHVDPAPLPDHIDPVNIPAEPAGDEYQPYEGKGHGSNSDFNKQLEEDRVIFKDGKFVTLTPEQAAAEAAAHGADAPVVGNVTENDKPLNVSGTGNKELNEVLSQPGLKFDLKTGKFFTSGGR